MDQINFIVLDNRITMINVSYLRDTPGERPGWSPETWAARIAQAFSLPDLSAWEAAGSALRLSCSGFSVSAVFSQPGVDLRDNAFQKTIDQRRAAEQERLRREFKP
ncbi:MAG: hypothetical protein U0Z53_06375 [Blastocatellia bacterium]